MNIENSPTSAKVVIKQKFLEKFKKQISHSFWTEKFSQLMLQKGFY